MTVSTTHYDWKAVYRNTLERNSDHRTALKGLWNQNVVQSGREIEFLTQIYEAKNPDIQRDLSYLLKGKRLKTLVKKYRTTAEQFARLWPLFPTQEKSELIWKTIAKNDRVMQFVREGFNHGTLDTVEVNGLLNKPHVTEQLLKKHRGDLDALAILWNSLNPDTQDKIWDQIIVPNGQEIELLAHERLQDKTSRTIFGRITYKDGRRKALFEKYKNDLQNIAFLQQYFPKKS